METIDFWRSKNLDNDLLARLIWNFVRETLDAFVKVGELNL